MSLHSGSTQLAHALDRFSTSTRLDNETIRATAAILDIDYQWVERYLELFGDDDVKVERITLVNWSRREVKVQPLTMSAFEAHLRKDLLGENLKIYQ